VPQAWVTLVDFNCLYFVLFLALDSLSIFGGVRLSFYSSQRLLNYLVDQFDGGVRIAHFFGFL